MKRVLLALFVGVFAISLVGCGGDAPKKTETPKKEEKKA